MENSLEGYVGRGIAHPPERIFDADRLLRAFEELRRRGKITRGRVARAKGIFHTTAGWRVHEIAGGRLSTETTSWRRDSRVDVILKNPGEGDFLEWEESARRRARAGGRATPDARRRCRRDARIRSKGLRCSVAFTF
jgi:hypothetical protein